MCSSLALALRAAALLARLRALRADERGTFAVSFAFIATAAVTVIAMAADYSATMNTRGKLEVAADAAVLAGVNAYSVDKTLSKGAQELQSKTRAENQFTGAAKALGVDVTSVSVISNLASNGEVTVALNWTATTKSNFGRVLKTNQLNFKGHSEARSSNTVYIDIIAVVDASGSMAIGASADDQRVMQSKMNCTFACHIGGKDETARALKLTDSKGVQMKDADGNPMNVRLRFDVVRGALLQMITKAKNMHGASDQFRFSVYKFSNRLTEVVSAETNLDTVKTKVSAMQLDDAPGMGTNFYKSLQQLKDKNAVPVSDDGTTAAKRKVYVLLMTDGIADDVFEVVTKSNGKLGGIDDKDGVGQGHWVKDPDYPKESPSFLENNQYIQGFNSTYCNPFKDRANMMTLNIDYVIPTNPDARFQKIRDILKPSIKSNMQGCATKSEWVYSASTPADISSAITTMFDAAVASARLTQ